MAPDLGRLNRRLIDSSTVLDAGLAIENCKKLGSDPAEWAPEERAQKARTRDMSIPIGLAVTLSQASRSDTPSKPRSHGHIEMLTMSIGHGKDSNMQA